MKRIEYIDALRGFTMILVVFAHVETFALSIEPNSTFLSALFISFRMPLFFFISGYISQKRSCINNLREWSASVGKKNKVQLLPTLFLGTIYTYFYLHINFYEFITDSAKLGYWFTVCLLLMFIVLYSINILIKNLNKPQKIVVLAIISMLLYALQTVFNNGDRLTMLGNIFCLHRFFMYFHFFVLGHIAAMCKDSFNRFLNNQYIITSAILVFTVLFYISINYNYIRWCYLISFPLLGYAGIIVVYNYFKVHQDSFSSNKRIGRILQYIGKRTLDIYLLHYFFLPQVPQLKLFLSNPANTVIELSVCMVLSLMIVCICLIVSNILRTSPVLAKYLFGVK